MTRRRTLVPDCWTPAGRRRCGVCGCFRVQHEGALVCSCCERRRTEALKPDPRLVAMVRVLVNDRG